MAAIIFMKKRHDGSLPSCRWIFPSHNPWIYFVRKQHCQFRRTGILACLEDRHSGLSFQPDRNVWPPVLGEFSRPLLQAPFYQVKPVPIEKPIKSARALLVITVVTPEVTAAGLMSLAFQY
jgi:hypothetical protein